MFCFFPLMILDLASSCVADPPPLSVRRCRCQRSCTYPSWLAATRNAHFTDTGRPRIIRNHAICKLGRNSDRLSFTSLLATHSIKLTQAGDNPLPACLPACLWTNMTGRHELRRRVEGRGPVVCVGHILQWCGLDDLRAISLVSRFWQQVSRLTLRRWQDPV